MHRIRGKLTYANVIASLALFIALAGGSAFAASQFGKETIGSRAIKKESIGPGKLTKAAKDTLQGPAGPTGPAGPAGAAGAAGSAVAYAHVNSDGTLDAALSKNIAATKVTAQSGYYCVNATVPVKNVIATAADNISARMIVASFSDPFTSCPPNAAVIETWDAAGKFTNSAFFVAFN